MILQMTRASATVKLSLHIVRLRPLCVRTTLPWNGSDPTRVTATVSVLLGGIPVKRYQKGIRDWSLITERCYKMGEGGGAVQV